MTFQLFAPTEAFAPRKVTPAQPIASDYVPFGVHEAGDGVDVAVLAGQATAVEICFFEGTRPLPESGAHATRIPAQPSEQRFSLHQNYFGVWMGHIPGKGAGSVYGLRAYGLWNPEKGLFYNPAKVMLDPYARAIAQMPILHSSLYAHQVDENLAALPGLTEDPQDSSRYCALGMVLKDFPDASHVHVPWDQTVIYEAHTVGLTKRMHEVPPELRGTYAGLAYPATIEHLKKLGVTTLELLPIHAKMPEPMLTMKGLTNYWGYNTLNFFMPEPSYATLAAQEAGPEAVIDEVRGMVSILHEAGIEVVLDVVYNHTNEGGIDGLSTSFRGLNYAGYYRHDPAHPLRMIDSTGCGNSLDFRNHESIQLILDSLRYWVKTIGIDGFRFDLAVTLGRQGDDYQPTNPLYTAMLADPVLKNVKLINEPWDIGFNGWQTGNFPERTADWNDRFRDCVRTFWLHEPASITAGSSTSNMRDLATRISGSADLFSHGRTPQGRGVYASINFVTAHDGFSVWDLVSYNSKHNEDNLEENRDGSDNNHSWNHGVEGFHLLSQEKDHGATILADRRQSVRNILGTLALAAGTPMFRAGDEILTSQRGNNNAYCQDNEINWLAWDISEEAAGIRDTLSYLLRLRAEHPVLRPTRFYKGMPLNADHMNDLEWYSSTGKPLPDSGWFDQTMRTLQMLRSGFMRAHGQHDRDALVVINGDIEPQTVILPRGRGKDYELMWSSVWEHPEQRANESQLLYPPQSEWRIPPLTLALFFA